jgi:hypothetical protein
VIDLGFFFLWRRRFAGRQIHFQIIHHLGSGDNENDKQHKDQIEQGRDVQLVQGAVM